MTVNVGVVKVPDERLTRLTELFKPKREVPADVTYVDLPAPPLSLDGREAAEIPADQLARLRTADELLHVVRAFENPAVAHPDGSVDPARDVERLDLEFVLADLAVIEKRIEKLSTSGPPRHAGRARVKRARAGRARADRAGAARGHADSRHRADRRRAEAHPRLPLPDREAGARPAQHRRGRCRAQPRELVADFAATLQAPQSGVEALSARIEMEIGQLDEEEAAIFRSDLGLTESSLEKVIRDSYRLLGLISFFTAGPDETRAWTIPAGSTAVDAAAAIHSDLARGFIRAEIVDYDDLIKLGSFAEARKVAKLRSEGKDYQMKDGDVVEIRFNV